MQDLLSSALFGPANQAYLIHPASAPSSAQSRDQCKQTRCSLSPNANSGFEESFCAVAPTTSAPRNKCSNPLDSLMPPSRAWRNRSVRASFFKRLRILFNSTLRYSVGTAKGGGIIPSPVRSIAYVVRDKVITVVTRRSKGRAGPALSVMPLSEPIPLLAAVLSLLPRMLWWPSYRQNAWTATGIKSGLSRTNIATFRGSTTAARCKCSDIDGHNALEEERIASRYGRTLLSKIAFCTSIGASVTSEGIESSACNAWTLLKGHESLLPISKQLVES
mmetsp:Transcript_9002/g.19299  ORF Transcript_9002/g.19299 Transcript_9002/m.19299 type:complete len:276 (+) Transcript_9002:1267-2094(+)